LIISSLYFVFMRILKTAVAAAAALSLLLPAGAAFAEQGKPLIAPTKGPKTAASSTWPTNRQKMASSTEHKARMEAKHEEVKQRLAALQDKRKQEMAVKLSAQFDTLNARWTDHFAKELDQMDKILGKIEIRAGLASSSGASATESAHAAIDSARAAVLAQAEKSYTIATSTLPTTASSTPSGQDRLIQTLRSSFKTLHQTLFTDLKALRDGPMKSARKAVQNAAVTLGKVKGEDGTEATSTESEAD
jgi:hypothetical protein